MVKLSYRIGEDFSYEGFFHIAPNKMHDLDSYLIVGAKGNIVECSRAVIDGELEGHPSVDQYFNEPKVGQLLVLITCKGSNTYEPLVELKEDATPFYFYAKCINSQSDLNVIEEPVDNNPA